MMRVVLTLCLLLAAPAVVADVDVETDQARSICVVGDLYNTGGGPCEGVYCEGWSRGGWQRCIDIHP